MEALHSPAFAAAALWAGANLLLTLTLALNVTRHRMQLGVSVGAGDSPQLERVVRAHGNNAEYVPGALLALALLALTGTPALTIHCLGAALLLARLLHAHGIRVLEGDGPPPTRVAGNIITWLVYLGSAGLLIANAIRSLGA